MTHRIVIVGGGAGGLELATRLGRKLGKRGQAKIVLIDANATHIWKPLLHEVAAGSLNSTEDELSYVAQAKWNHFDFQLGRMTGLDRERRKVQLAAIEDDGAVLVPEREIGYDSLVLAIGSTTNDFGTPGAAENCIFLDTRAQAERFHRKLLTHYLRAHVSEQPGEFIEVAIVGAGATGVELAAELRNAAEELQAYGLDRIRPEDLRITVVEAGPRILPALPERIAGQAHRTLEKLGVRVLTGSAVKEVRADGLQTASEFVPASLKVWAAGIRAPAFLKDLAGLETNRINQLVVHSTLQTTRDPNVFALGDCAACPLTPGDTRTVPPRAQSAHQQASLLVKTFKAQLEGKPLPEYRYKDYGSLISLSRFSAVGNLMGGALGSLTLEGWLARTFYVSLYRMHQVALYGPLRALALFAGDHLRRKTEPRLKLH
ncbi:NAD(P)/FAD-dependent oxidoreductase [Pseudomonas rhizoryzae]|uniref:NAD(P)/FAD-dependent oxidoreductase n=1 Tax=Pseudomonas rhizoryzae TaxID=2571129 RepID=UPI0007366F85|nr:NAD(P)/FAD-dependent oxidoreductase [Pseudomonas rhizoryzae]KTT32209.1 NADH dehydrogenase [Pseudomonas psychrotolerans]KTT32291.1 NADH dehydrogenase [Pseudomonas psychrotolerans]KTT74294.1 NADH dehydrogenase [Pseudomonas psychrotolerans]